MTPTGYGDIITFLEKCGRVCYKSEDKITSESAPKFCKAILQRNHESVLEHRIISLLIDYSLSEEIAQLKVDNIDESISLFNIHDYKNDYSLVTGNIRSWIHLINHGNWLKTHLIYSLNQAVPDLFELPAHHSVGSSELVDINNIKDELEEGEYEKHKYESVKFIIDRGVSHELVRHRICSFSQESTRYCNYGKANNVTFIIPPWCKIEEGEYTQNGIIPVGWSDFTSEENDYTWYCSMLSAEKDYLRLLKNGWTPQQARSVLPNSLKTEIVVTANLREWQHIMRLRTDKAAHPQMREISLPLQEEFKQKYPLLF